MPPRFERFEGAKDLVFDGGHKKPSGAAPEAGGTAMSGMVNATRTLRHMRRTLHLNAKLYISASRVALGQRRWISSVAVLSVLSMGLLGTGMAAIVVPYSGVENAALTADAAPQVIALDENTDAATLAALDPASMPVAQIALAPVKAPEPTEVHTTISISSGETLMEVLTEAGVDKEQAYQAIASMEPVFSPRSLRAGQQISLTFMQPPVINDAVTQEGQSPALKQLVALTLQPDIERAIAVRRSDDGDFVSEEIQKALTVGSVRAAGTINSSLFVDGAHAGVPAQIIVEMIRMFSYSVDFQREIQPGDAFEVFFDRKYDEGGLPVKEGQIAYASLTINGKAHKLWRFKSKSGGWDYFDEKGNSMKKFLMKTPIDGARISSGFGKRRHPILGYSKMHSGVDFAAPKGTPIYAAGDGTVKTSGWQGGYGKFVEIRHANNYNTAYGHMSAIAKGIKPGTRVRQGQVIGYVGSTGRSTGPHLHYEIRIAGKKVNPLGVKMATGVKLSGKELASFQDTRGQVATKMAEAPLLTRVAQASSLNASKAN